MIYSCKGCIPPKRYPGCHDHCPEYLEAKKKHDEEKAKRDAAADVISGLREQQLRVMAKIRKGMRRN